MATKKLEKFLAKEKTWKNGHTVFKKKKKKVKKEQTKEGKGRKVKRENQKKKELR